MRNNDTKMVLGGGCRHSLPPNCVCQSLHTSEILSDFGRILDRDQLPRSCPGVFFIFFFHCVVLGMIVSSCRSHDNNNHVIILPYAVFGQ